MGDRNEFDDWLDSELRRRLDPHLSSVPAPRYSNHSFRRGPMPKLISGLVAALATKTAAGLSVAALAAGATGAVAVGVQTGAIRFNESMKTVVADCKNDAPTNGEHGIGACVATTARHHGSEARLNNPGQGHKPGQAAKPEDAGKPAETGKPASPGHSGEHAKPKASDDATDVAIDGTAAD